MSGGYFEYKHHITDIADSLQSFLDNKEDIKRGFSEDIEIEFKALIGLLRLVQIGVTRADYLLSGDDDEETYHKRLDEDLTNLEKTL